MADAAVPLPDDMIVDDSPLSDEDLDAYLADEVWEGSGPGEEVADHPVARWLITNLADAEWAMGRMALAQDHVRELTEQRDEWARNAMAKIDKWHARSSRRAARTVQVMAAKLERYALEQRALDPKVKSIPLPSGVVKTTGIEPSAQILDDDLVAAIVNRGLLEGTEGAWYKKLHAAEVGMDDLIRESTKVYVGPFRKLVTVAEVPTGVVRYIVDLTCEHTITDEFGADDLEASTEVPPLGSYLPCTECAPDPIDGPPERGVAAVERLELTEWRVLGPDGKPIPGTSVDLGGTTAKAVPGA